MYVYREVGRKEGRKAERKEGRKGRGEEGKEVGRYCMHAGAWVFPTDQLFTL